MERREKTPDAEVCPQAEQCGERISSAAAMRLLQFSDSMFPVGTFSFSSGLETAGFEHVVHDAATLREFTLSQVEQAAWSDGIAMLHAYRAYNADDYEGILRADRALMLCKMSDEARLMLKRMGKKLAELGVRLFSSDSRILRWLGDINADTTPGTYPVAQGLAFAAAGVPEEDMFCSHQYGVANMVLSAALRCVRVSHYDTQEILYELSGMVGDAYREIKDCSLSDIRAFYPELDILASLHEKGNMRMFMN